MSAQERFHLGVNYWPRTKAMRMWSEFDAGVIADDFALISELGMSTVRLFLLWEDFQPQPRLVSSQALDHLEVVCELAQRHRLSLNVTFFTGHMSGPNWIPSWMLRPGRTPPRVNQVVSAGCAVDSAYVNPFSDAAAIEAQQLLLRTVVERFRTHPAIGIWNLGNEPDLVAHPPNAEAGRTWTRRMVETVKSVGATQPVGFGLHTSELLEDVGFRVDQVFAETDVAAMHAYPMYQDWARNPLDTEVVPFCCALTSALCGKPTLMEEFGGCTAVAGQRSGLWEFEAFGRPRKQFMASEEALAEYLQAVLPQLQQVGATGALLWSFADYAPELWQRPPCDQAQHERSFGLIRPDGSLKPHAEVIRQFARTRPQVLEATRRVDLGVTPDAYYSNPKQHLLRLFAEFCAQRGS